LRIGIADEKLKSQKEKNKNFKREKEEDIMGTCVTIVAVLIAAAVCCYIF